MCMDVPNRIKQDSDGCFFSIRLIYTFFNNKRHCNRSILFCIIFVLRLLFQKSYRCRMGQPMKIELIFRNIINITAPESVSNMRKAS